MQTKIQKEQKVPKRRKTNIKSVAFFTLFASFWQHIQILFVKVNQCNTQKICLLQWISATNKTNLRRSDSVRQNILKKYPISLWYVTNELEKSQKQTSFYIWISPPLSNCFGVPFVISVFLVAVWHHSQVCLKFP